MNLLAHIYLSGSTEEIMIGNFMGDFIKGKAYLNYSENIQKGILLHRKIDHFTDSHAITKHCKTFVSEKYGKYSGIIIDLFFDYFLASQWKKYNASTLKSDIEKVFEVLDRHQQNFPIEMMNWYPKLIQNNWLMLYSTLEGMERIIRGMTVHSSLPDHTDFAISVLKEHENVLSSYFNLFFKDIQAFVKEEFGIIANDEFLSR